MADEWMNYTTAGASMQWNIWDWGSRGAANEAQKQAYKSIFSREQDLRATLENNFHQLKRDYQTLLKQVQVQKQSVDVAEQKARILDDQFKAGVASSSDYLDAEKDLTNEKLKLEQTQLDILAKTVELDYLSGKPISEWRL